MNKRIIDLRVIFNFFYERLDVCINFNFLCVKNPSLAFYTYTETRLGDYDRCLFSIF